MKRAGSTESTVPRSWYFDNRTEIHCRPQNFEPFQKIKRCVEDFCFPKGSISFLFRMEDSRKQFLFMKRRRPMTMRSSLVDAREDKIVLPEVDLQNFD